MPGLGEANDATDTHRPGVGWRIRSCGFAAFLAIAWHSAIPPSDRLATTFEPALIAKGAQLALIGNCNVVIQSQMARCPCAKLKLVLELVHQ